MRPTVGITAATESVSYGSWRKMEAILSPLSYIRAVQRAGGRAVLLVPDDADARDPGELLGLTDALILTGGAGDLDPALYGEELHPATGPVQPERDAFELALAGAALERRVPVLGICRGMQVLNVAGGGSIEQHLPDVVGHNDHRPTPGTFTTHEVRLASGSLAARVAGARRLPVKTHHHQGVRRVGEGLVATGWSALDGIIEAIEAEDGGFALGVLWHPEEDEESKVIANLIREVGAHA